MASWNDDTAQYRETILKPETKRIIARAPFVKSLNTHLSYAFSMAPPIGFVAEFGVWHGQSIQLLANLAETVFGFDSFLGLPESWEDINRTNPGGYVKAGQFNRDEIPPAAPENVQMIVGWFEDTLPAFAEEVGMPARFLHIDCDLYSSTMTVLTELAEHIVPGTVILFDEFWDYSAWRKHEWLAFMECAERFGWTWTLTSWMDPGYQASVRIDSVRG